MKSKAFAEQLTKDIQNNILLGKKGEKSITVEIKGDHGIGKTEIVKQVAKKAFGKEGSFIYLSMAQFEDPADFVGYPKQEILVERKNGEKVERLRIQPQLLLFSI